MARTGRIRVRQLVDDRDLRMPDKNRVEVHFRLGGAAIFQLRARHDRQAFEQRFRLRPAVRFNNADHHLAAILLRLSRRLNMAKVLPTPGHIPKKIFSLPRADFASSRLIRARISSGLGVGTFAIRYSKTVAYSFDKALFWNEGRR